MAKVVVVAKCKDQATWEAGFKTRGELFRSEYAVTKPVSYGMSDDNHEESPATAEAMGSDELVRN